MLCHICVLNLQGYNAIWEGWKPGTLRKFHNFLENVINSGRSGKVTEFIWSEKNIKIKNRSKHNNLLCLNNNHTILCYGIAAEVQWIVYSMSWSTKLFYGVYRMVKLM